MTNTTATTIKVSAEDRALSVITSGSATELQAQAVFMAVQPLAKRAYLAGNDREQWANKPTEKRPLRQFWATLYAAKGFNKDGSPKWVDNKKPVKAMRAAASAILATMDDKTRDKSDEGLETFMLTIETIIISVFAPARAEKPSSPTNDADKAKKAIDSAIALVNKAMADHLLSEEQIAAIAAMAHTASKTRKAEAMSA